MPFSSFRPAKPDDPPLDPFLVHTLIIRFEPRRQVRVESKLVPIFSLSINRFVRHQKEGKNIKEKVKTR